MPKDKATSESTAFSLNDDQKSYLEIMKLTGKEFDLASEIGQRKFIVNYNNWVAKDRPKPKLELNEEEAPYPVKLVRLKDRGRQFIKWFGSDHKWHGVTIERKEETVTDPGSNLQHVRRSEIVHHDIPFTKDGGDRLRQEAEDKCEDPIFLFKWKNKTVSVEPNMWTGDFDEVFKNTRRV